MLTQVTIMDFIVTLCESKSGVGLMNESNFME